MRKARKPLIPLGILIREEEDTTMSSYQGYSYYHIRGHIVTAVDGKVRNPPSGSYDSSINGFDRLADLEINSQGETSRVTQGLYGFDVRYRNVSYIEARDAKAMHQTLTKIDKGMSKLYTLRGMARSYGEYVGRVAEVLGASSILFDRYPEAQGSFHAERDYMFLSVGDGVNRIDHMVNRWQAKHAPKAEEAVS